MLLVFVDSRSYGPADEAIKHLETDGCQQLTALNAAESNE